MMRLMFCMAAVALLPGCGGLDDNPERVVVRGQVTYQGEPVQEGKIRFIPEKGPVAVAEITNGQYLVDSRGGVPVGTHRVVIEAYRPQAGAKPASAEVAEAFADIEEGEVAKEQFLPSKYSGGRSTLQAEVESGSDSITKNFELD